LTIEHKARNAFLNKNVFGPALKESSVCVALRWSGRLFHKRGAAEQKARSRMVRSLVLETQRSELLAALRVQVEMWVSVCEVCGVYKMFELQPVLSLQQHSAAEPVGRPRGVLPWCLPSASRLTLGLWSSRALGRCGE